MAHSNVFCIKCGQTGSSKCPFCRSVFPLTANPKVIQLEQFITIDRTDDDCAKVTFRAFNPTVAHANVLAVVQELIKGLTDKELTEVTCLHDYRFSPGATSTIGCGHGASDTD